MHVKALGNTLSVSFPRQALAAEPKAVAEAQENMATSNFS